MSVYIQPDAEPSSLKANTFMLSNTPGADEEAGSCLTRSLCKVIMESKDENLSLGSLMTQVNRKVHAESQGKQASGSHHSLFQDVMISPALD